MVAIKAPSMVAFIATAPVAPKWCKTHFKRLPNLGYKLDFALGSCVRNKKNKQWAGQHTGYKDTGNHCVRLSAEAYLSRIHLPLQRVLKSLRLPRISSTPLLIIRRH